MAFVMAKNRQNVPVFLSLGAIGKNPANWNFRVLWYILLQVNEKRVKNETPDEDGLSMTPSQEFISIDVDENSMSSIDLGINLLLNFDANILEKYAKIIRSLEFRENEGNA